MKKLLLIFLILNVSGMIIASVGRTQSIQEIIEQSSTGAENAPDASTEKKSVKNSGSDRFFAVQFGTFFDESSANDQIMKLKSAGLVPYLFQSINSKGNTIYATRIGKFDSFFEASQEIKRLESSINSPMLITHFDSLMPAASEPTRDYAPPAAAAAPQETDFEKKIPDDSAVESAYSGEALTIEALQNKLLSMEKDIQKLRDETDIRSQLQITEEEQKAEEEDILEAAGREYTLTEEGNIKLSCGVSYGYSGYDAIRESTRVEDVADHTIATSLSVSYGLKDNLTVGTSVPFIYKYHKVGTGESLEATDLGDLSLSWQFQPFKATTDLPTIILNGSFGIPVGRSPYDIQVGEELSTSSGIYDANFGVSVSQVTDPVVVFSSFSLSYPFAVKSIDQKRDEGTLDAVDPGMGVGAAVGLGYALSYKLNLNMSFSYSYSFSTTYKYKNAPDAKSGTSTGASIRIGTGYKLSRNQNINFSIGIPITSSRSFSLSLSTPIDFEL